uniref:RNA binding protein n=1 Tax=Chinook aquareovirus TaxID=2587490 RepID=A0A5B9NA05_9REOV|nr:MAG: RNA binding protein [Chinook aquareovirus]
MADNRTLAVSSNRKTTQKRTVHGDQPMLRFSIEIDPKDALKRSSNSPALRNALGLMFPMSSSDNSRFGIRRFELRSLAPTLNDMAHNDTLVPGNPRLSVSLSNQLRTLLTGHVPPVVLDDIAPLHGTFPLYAARGLTYHLSGISRKPGCPPPPISQTAAALCFRDTCGIATYTNGPDNLEGFITRHGAPMRVDDLLEFPRESLPFIGITYGVRVDTVRRVSADERLISLQSCFSDFGPEANLVKVIAILLALQLKDDLNSILLNPDEELSRSATGAGRTIGNSVGPLCLFDPVLANWFHLCQSRRSDSLYDVIRCYKDAITQPHVVTMSLHRTKDGTPSGSIQLSLNGEFSVVRPIRR